ncbi:invasion associated locus B family protein [Ruegeria pomeroyi]|uniref:Invasion associated locus B family protein n=2 Tax=Ruegeria TaxID=97050 RepID=A0A9Q3ZI41_9RHOB|nr:MULTISPECIES: invasion associated locus B family protein [Ruegeria]MCE8511518.1 invasion associated locus B family protein [Ruegeria pomeroyi]MCE8517258.1 invasion associated locus B family protein [Ruegeria pomeroyi]MCE8523927.1 invasion associated locus B family protein [Ruegeria pomeroyi]MCE8527812.1 invasion associated locus B family protein [Ruegeria pomeroyi]MCE8532345.1 invasion associated locus B family protein [Ruegeria pomeroyi]
MTKTLITLSAAALLALTGAATAQDTTTPAETAPAQEEQKTADQLLDLGTPADGSPQLGQRYSKEKIGDWDMACIKTEGETDPCSMLQILTDAQGNPMAEFSMFRLEEGGVAVAGATVIVPLETLLPAQLTISIDGAPGKRYNYSFCNPIGCIAQIGLTQADIDAMKKGAKATVSLVPAPAPDQTVSLELSLTGFTASYDKVDVVSN